MRGWSLYTLLKRLHHFSKVSSEKETVCVFQTKLKYARLFTLAIIIIISHNIIIIIVSQA